MDKKNNFLLIMLLLALANQNALFGMKKTVKEDNNFILLPTELYLEIFRYLPYNDFKNLFVVSKKFHQVLQIGTQETKSYFIQKPFKSYTKEMLKALRKKFNRWDFALFMTPKTFNTVIHRTKQNNEPIVAPNVQDNSNKQTFGEYLNTQIVFNPKVYALVAKYLLKSIEDITQITDKIKGQKELIAINQNLFAPSNGTRNDSFSYQDHQKVANVLAINRQEKDLCAQFTLQYPQDSFCHNVLYINITDDNTTITFPDISQEKGKLKLSLSGKLATAWKIVPENLRPKIQAIYIKNNEDSNFDTIPAEIISKYPNVKKIVATGCLLKAFPDVSSLRKLTRLDLSNNSIESIPENTNLPESLREINLEGNRITGNQSALDTLKKNNKTITIQISNKLKSSTRMLVFN